MCVETIEAEIRQTRPRSWGTAVGSSLKWETQPPLRLSEGAWFRLHRLNLDVWPQIHRRYNGIVSSCSSWGWHSNNRKWIHRGITYIPAYHHHPCSSWVNWGGIRLSHYQLKPRQGPWGSSSRVQGYDSVNIRGSFRSAKGKLRLCVMSLDLPGSSKPLTNTIPKHCTTRSIIASRAQRKSPTISKVFFSTVLIYLFFL